MARSQTTLGPRKSDTPSPSSSPLLSRPAPAPRSPNPVGGFGVAVALPAPAPRPKSSASQAVAAGQSSGESLPPLPELPPPVSSFPQGSRHGFISAPSSVIESRADDNDDELDQFMSSEIPVLPPKPESILSQMKEVAQQQHQHQQQQLETERVVMSDANALVSNAPPPVYAEFDEL